MLMLELLAPAGSMDALKAAVQNGADAVYLGCGTFNARQSAKNFTPQTLAEAVTEFDCPVYLGAEDAQLFNLEGTVAYEDATVMKFGEIKLFVFSTPGHTPGGYCLWAEGMLFCGDTLFAGTVGRTDMAGGDFTVLKESLKKILSTVDENPQVLPGHNHFSTLEQEKVQNPYLKNLR